MRVDALGFVMFMIVGAPFCFEKEDIEVEVGILRHQVMNEPDLNILHRVSKRAIVSVLTLRNLMREAVAELRFILVLVIEALNSVMRSTAFISFWAFFSVREFAKLRSIKIVISPLVFNGVVIVAGLVIMRSILSRAFYSLEILKVKVPD